MEEAVVSKIISVYGLILWFIAIGYVFVPPCTATVSRPRVAATQRVSFENDDNCNNSMNSNCKAHIMLCMVESKQK